jgi:hypothetical protein
VTRSRAFLPFRPPDSGRRGDMHYCALLLLAILIVLVGLVVLLA